MNGAPTLTGSHLGRAYTRHDEVHQAGAGAYGVSRQWRLASLNMVVRQMTDVRNCLGLAAGAECRQRNAGRLLSDVLLVNVCVNVEVIMSVDRAREPARASSMLYPNVSLTSGQSPTPIGPLQPKL